VAVEVAREEACERARVDALREDAERVDVER
jgi:hypothetical protein